MIRVRLLFYVLYVILGSVLAARLIAAGLRVESITGMVLAVALIALGLYRLTLFRRFNGSRR